MYKGAGPESQEACDGVEGAGVASKGRAGKTQQRTLENSGGRRDGSQQIGQQRNETSTEITMVDGSASSQGPGGQTPQRKGGLVSRMWACEDGRPPRVLPGEEKGGWPPVVLAGLGLPAMGTRWRSAGARRRTAARRRSSPASRLTW